MEADQTEVLLAEFKSVPVQNSFREANIELKKLRSRLSYVFLDQSNIWRAGLSWSLFFLLTVCVPLVSHFVFSCSRSRCDEDHRRPFDAIVQLSLSVFATLSFISLSCFTRKYGLRKFLFLDKLDHESEKVRQGYALEIHVSHHPSSIPLVLDYDA